MRLRTRLKLCVYCLLYLLYFTHKCCAYAYKLLVSCNRKSGFELAGLGLGMENKQVKQ